MAAMADEVPPSTLAQFAAANDAAAATTKKLEKQALLAAYLRELDETDLPLAVRFAAGRPFAVGDERVLGASSSLVSSVVVPMFDLEGEDWHARVVRNGEFGEAMAELWQERVDAADADRWQGTSPLTLTDLQSSWDALAATGRQENKRDVLRDLLVRLRTPREAAYAGKIIFGDLRTGVREGVLHAAVAEAFGREFDAIRRAVLLVGDVGEVALLAKHDRLGEARFKLFHPLSFMLASPTETPEDAASAFDLQAPDAPDDTSFPPSTSVSPASAGAGRRAPTPAEAGDAKVVVQPESVVTDAPPETPSPSVRPDHYLAEHKLDGIRAQIHKQGEYDRARLAIYTRTMDRADAGFPDVVAQARTLPGDWLLDGEIVPYDDATGQVLPFATIQKRLGRKDPSPAILKKYPCRFVAFDCLYRDGDNLLDEPLTTRRDALLELVGDSAEVLVSHAAPVRAADDVQRAFDASRAARNEGLILKNPQSPYAPGRRGKHWLKLKTHLPTLDVVVTAAEHGHGKRRNHLSDYTFAVWTSDPADEPDAKLVNVGKAFSGVTDAEIEQLTELFLSIQTGKYGRVYTVQPKVVFEVAFDAIQESKRHAGGFALRFPRIKRIRWDRSPESADRLERVREIHDHEQNFNRVAVDEAAEDADAAGDEANPQMSLF